MGRENELRGRDDRFRKIFALIVVTIFSALFLRLIAPFLQALLLAAVLSGLVYPWCQWLQKRFANRIAAAGITTFLVLIAIVLPVLFIVGAFAAQAVQLAEQAAPWIQQQADSARLAFQLPAWLPFADELEPYEGQIMSRLGEAVSQAGSFLVESLSSITQMTFLFILNLFIMLYAMFFFLLAGPRLIDVFDYTPLTRMDRQIIAEKGVSITRATLKGTVITGLLQGGLAGAAFAVVGIPGAVFWSVIMALVSVVPGVGAALIWVPAVIVLLVQGQIVAGIGLAVWCATVVSTVDNVVRPRLVGGDTQMHDVLILLSTLGGIAMFGVAGIIIGPILAGFFLTSWHIFAAAFRKELDTSEDGPRLLEEEGGRIVESDQIPERPTETG